MSVSYQRALLGLFVGSFAIGTTEFAPMGLLPEIALGVGVSIPRAGALVSAYAIGVMMGAPVMTWLLRRTARRHALMFLMLVFTAGNLLTAVSQSYWGVLLARLITSLSHGAFFGIGAVVASSVVPQSKRATAVAFMFLGLTIANIGGVPAAALIGQTIGWRMSFALMSVLGILSALGTWYSLPAAVEIAQQDSGQGLGVLRKGTVWRALGTTVLGAGSMFTIYTYISPLLTELSHFKVSEVSAVLVLIGTGFTVGNLMSGRFADRNLRLTLQAFLGLLAAVMVVYPLTVHSQVAVLVTLFIWGIAAFAVATPLQLTVIQSAREAPALVSSLNIGAFNLGNALGAAVGAAIVEADLGYNLIPLASGGLALLGMLLSRWDGATAGLRTEETGEATQRDGNS